MVIPTQREIRLPLLKICRDEKEHLIKDVIEQLSEHFKLSKEERDEMYPSRNEKIFSNRVRWARWDLIEANLIESVRRGVIKITQAGLEFLSTNPTEISNDIIKKMKEKNMDTLDESETLNSEFVQTPEEIIEKNLQIIEKELKEELLTQIKNCSSGFFERLVVDLLLKMGYGGTSGDIAKVIGGTGDEGIDGIIYQDKLGLEKIYIQAKKWVGSTVGRNQLQEFVGALEGKNAKKGVFITTSRFSRAAEEYAKNNSRIVIIDGDRLVQLMIEHDVGVSTIQIYKRKKIDYDYFPEE